MAHSTEKDLADLSKEIDRLLARSTEKLRERGLMQERILGQYDKEQPGEDSLSQATTSNRSASCTPEPNRLGYRCDVGGQIQYGRSSDPRRPPTLYDPLSRNNGTRSGVKLDSFREVDQGLHAYLMPGAGHSKMDRDSSPEGVQPASPFCIRQRRSVPGASTEAKVVSASVVGGHRNARIGPNADCQESGELRATRKVSQGSNHDGLDELIAALKVREPAIFCTPRNQSMLV